MAIGRKDWAGSGSLGELFPVRVDGITRRTIEGRRCVPSGYGDKVEESLGVVGRAEIWVLGNKRNVVSIRADGKVTETTKRVDGGFQTRALAKKIGNRIFLQRVDAGFVLKGNAVQLGLFGEDVVIPVTDKQRIIHHAGCILFRSCVSVVDGPVLDRFG